MQYLFDRTIGCVPAKWWLLLVALALLFTFMYALGDEGRADAVGGVVSVAGGDSHTCAVLGDGGVQCWGANDEGQLGDGTNDPSDTPVDVCASGAGPACAGGTRLTGIVEVAAGFRHTCARTESGGVKCWGANTSGQLGDGTTDQRDLPVDVCATGSGAGCSGGTALSGVVQLDSGSAFNCALMDDTGIKCWGSDGVGQLGIDTSSPMAGTGTFGGGFGGFEPNPVDVCVIVAMAVLGAGQVEPSTSGVVCEPVDGFAQVATGAEFACALTTEGGAQCWGSNEFGELGDGTDIYHGSPEDVCNPPLAGVPGVAGGGNGPSCDPTLGLSSIAAGDDHACAVTDAGQVRCWGRNLSGALGDGTESDRFSPNFVCATGMGFGCLGGTPLEGMSAVTGGNSFSCAADNDGDLMCWGENFYGTLGDGTEMDSSNPVPASQVSSGVTIMKAGSRASHACAALDDGRLECWGRNTEGQLGRGSSGGNEAHPPEAVDGFGDPKPTPTATTEDTPTPTDEAPVATDTPVGDTPTPTNTPAAPTSTPTPAPGGLIGDVDCSGAVNAIDAAFILQFVAGLITDLPCPQNADANEDGVTNTVDAALILQFSAGLLGSLPP